MRRGIIYSEGISVQTNIQITTVFYPLIIKKIYIDKMTVNTFAIKTVMHKTFLD